MRLAEYIFVLWKQKWNPNIRIEDWMFHFWFFSSFFSWCVFCANKKNILGRCSTTIITMNWSLFCVLFVESKSTKQKGKQKSFFFHFFCEVYQASIEKNRLKLYNRIYKQMVVLDFTNKNLVLEIILLPKIIK